MMSNTNSDTWAFSTNHDFSNDQKSFIEDLKNRKDLFRLFIATTNLSDIDFVTKGLIKFEQGVNDVFVKSVVDSRDIFPTNHWDGLAEGLTSDGRFKTHEVIWVFKPIKIEVPTTPTREPLKKRDPIGLKGLDFINDDDVCLTCGS